MTVAMWDFKAVARGRLAGRSSVAAVGASRAEFAVGLDASALTARVVGSCALGRLFESSTTRSDPQKLARSRR